MFQRGLLGCDNLKAAKGDLVRFVRPHKKEIVYNVLPTSNGWQIQAFLPNRISPNDRIVILDWFHGYRTQVHSENPMWLTFFHFGEQAYFLDIIPANGPKEMIAQAVEAAQTWQQLDLDLEYAGRG